ncbi:MAG: hypothetical protein QM820_06915 [Minicystis sp.]
MGFESPTPPVLKPLATAEGLSAAVLAKHHRIRSPRQSELKPGQVADALAWRELGVESIEPFTRNAVLAHIIRKMGGSASPPKDLRAALTTLASAALQVNRGTAPIRVALVQRWMAGGETAAVIPSATPPAETRPVTLEAFSKQALAAAHAAKTGRWGDQKVFVSHVWSEYQHRDGSSAVGLDDFKQMLVRANQAGLLSLSRADLVEEMDPADLKRSEIAALGATFHFVQIN